MPTQIIEFGKCAPTLDVLLLLELLHLYGLVAQELSPAVELILWVQNRLYSYRRMSERLLESLCITTGTLYREVSAAVRVLIRGVFFIRQSFVDKLHCTPIIIATHCLLTLPLENGCMDNLNQSIETIFVIYHQK